MVEVPLLKGCMCGVDTPDEMKIYGRQKRMEGCFSTLWKESERARGRWGSAT